jgi:cytochrome c biogenesis protein CcmG, thiol:disulfide interchange protein DsbE
MLPIVLLLASLVSNVRSLIAQHDFASAEHLTRAYQSQVGSTPEYAAAVSWLARAAFDAKRIDHAEALVAETRKVALASLASRPLDSDPYLPMALGGAIEVHAGVLNSRGERAEALLFLRDELKNYGATSIGERIRKNINLLSLEGKPAPAFEIAHWLGSVRPVSIASLRGRPVLFFFWAHWCSDCKAESPIIATLKANFGPSGLVVVAPTRLYGYVAGGKDAPAEEEKQYIESIRRQYYPALADVAVPLSSANFLTYGASTTPTIVLVDRAGIVRLYHPGAMSLAELSTRVNAILEK